MTDSVVISGAVAVRDDSAAPAPLLSVPDVLDLAVVDSGSEAQLVIHNAAAAPLAAFVEGTGELIVGPGDSAAVAVPSTVDGDRLQLQILSAALLCAVTAIVSIERTSEGRIAVGQAIGAHAA